MLEQEDFRKYFTGKGLLRHVYLRANDDFSEVLLCLVLNGAALPNEESFKKTLQENHPEIKGFLINTNTENTNVILGDEPSPDLGYPASVELEDGNILTVLYSRDGQGGPSVIKQVIWNFEK